MLKKIEDFLHLLVNSHLFFLFKCSAETKKEVLEAGIKFKEFEDVDVMEKDIQNKFAKEYIEVLSPVDHVP